MERIINFKYYFFNAALAVITLTTYSQEKYKVSEIPKDLLANAKAVIRNSETVFEISDIGKATEKITYAITILNQNGIDKSVFYDFYGKFNSIRKFDWTLYDQDGIRIRKNTNVLLKDYSAISGFSLYEDNRIKFLDPNYRATPFTVEYKYEIDYDGLLNYPDMKVYDAYNVSVEKMIFSIIVPDGFKFRYLQKNMSDSCFNNVEHENNGKGSSLYKWTVVNKPALREEPFGTALEEYTPVVYTAPDEFELSGYKGDLESWKEFGKWIKSINEGRTKLGPQTSEKITELISQKKSEKEKVECLYKYLQEKVRYVSIQVGLGGWQTIDAETVDRLSYGDCKALSNYMKSLLDLAGIKNYYTLAMAGENAPEIKERFPSNQFNHVIICVPFEKDTTWLECTSQEIPAGYIGKFTDDRNVLLIGNDGGVLVRTKKYKINDNQQQRKAVVKISGDGNAESSVLTKYEGINYDDIYPALIMDDADRKKDIEKKIPIKSFTVEKFKYSEKREEYPSVTEELELGLPNYGTITGNRIFFNPNLITRFGKLPYRTTDRKSIIHIKRPYIQTDTIIYKLPVSYKVEQVPENRTISTKFGEYNTSVNYDMQEVRYIRTFKLYNGDFPASDYPDFVNFCEKTSTMDDRKVVLVKLF
jgi:transglutaminase-like putative cysteine protease